MPRSEDCRWGPKKQRMAKTELILPSLRGQRLSLLHRHGCALWFISRVGESVFVLLFFNLGLKFPLRQSCLQQDQNRHQKLVGSLCGLQSQTPESPLNPSSTQLDTLQHSGPSSKKKVQPLPHCRPATHPQDTLQLRGLSKRRYQGHTVRALHHVLCSVPSLGATGEDKEP